jgi:hypothetical protein
VKNESMLHTAFFVVGHKWFEKLALLYENNDNNFTLLIKSSNNEDKKNYTVI